MSITPYATFSEFTEVYSFKAVTQADVNSWVLPKGTIMVNERLASHYTTPFSSNNLTPKSLAIDFGAVAILERTRNQTDSLELNKSIDKRIQAITEGGGRMSLSDGTTLDPTNDEANFISVNQEYKPTFDMREPIDQRVDPDLLWDQWADDL